MKGKDDKQKHSKEQPVSISSDEETEPDLVIEGQQENLQIDAGTGPIAQTTGANASVNPLEIEASLAEEIEQQEQEADQGEAEVSVPTPEVLATAVVTTPTPTSDHTYSTTVSIPTPASLPPTVSSSSSAPTPIPIYSTPHDHLSSSLNNRTPLCCDNAHIALCFLASSTSYNA